jgi:hypothetical protein
VDNPAREAAMTNRPESNDPDPELSDVDALRRAERERKRSSARVRHGSTALIVFAVAVLLILALASVWIVTQP